MIKKVSIEELKDYIDLAKKSNLTFCSKTNYFAKYINNEIVAFCGVLPYKNKWILKNAYTLKEHRGKGYHKQLMEFRIHMAKTLGIKTLEATCTPMSLNNYLRYGFKIIKEYKEVTKVRRDENIIKG